MAWDSGLSLWSSSHCHGVRDGGEYSGCRNQHRSAPCRPKPNLLTVCKQMKGRASPFSFSLPLYISLFGKPWGQKYAVWCVCLLCLQAFSYSSGLQHWDLKKWLPYNSWMWMWIWIEVASTYRVFKWSFNWNDRGLLFEIKLSLKD